MAATPTVENVAPQVAVVVSAPVVPADGFAGTVAGRRENPAAHGPVLAGVRQGKSTNEVFVDPTRELARNKAAEIEGQRVGWNNPAGALDRMSQIDSNRGAQAGGTDEIRCGAACIVAGVVLQGRAQAGRSVVALQSRADGLLAEYASRPAAASSSSQANLLQARDTFARLSQTPPSQWTQGDLQAYQQALFNVISADARLDRDSGAVGPPLAGLPTNFLVTYRDLAWGDTKPQMQGQPVDIFAVPDWGGHAVLCNEAPRADGSHRLAYDPMPGDDGTAYARGIDASVELRRFDQPSTGDIDSFGR